MLKNLRFETRFFLECLAEASADAADVLLHPTLGRLTSLGGCRDDCFEKKLRLLAARGIITLPQPTDPRIVRLTQLGRECAVSGIDPEARWAREWDGSWRFVLFDVAEVDRKIRDRLRRELGRARMGYLQGSVWVSPEPLAELRKTVESVAANPEALLFIEGRPCGGESDAAIVEGGWNFARINEAYRANLAAHETVPRVSDSPSCWRQWLAHERETWQAAIALDPLLPHSLLPGGYLGRKAFGARRKAIRSFTAHYFSAKR
jgi:phenylacetic acid degradation operon negative regulatory protein